jgi:eukaryotic-like serine/threonine-protein kinase
MTPELWARLNPLFNVAIEKPIGEREAYVAEACASDVELRRELVALLQAHEQQRATTDKVKVNIENLIGTVQTRFSPSDIILGRFKIVRRLGGGGMGDVYEAVDLELDQTVALKSIRPDIAGNDGVVSRFKKEVQLARRLGGPNVCRIHELFVIPGDGVIPARAFLTMEFLDGITLAHKLKQTGPILWSEANPIAADICGGLFAMHQAGIIHRDLKTQNIMLAERGGSQRAVLMDFGLARELAVPSGITEAALTVPGALIGTPEYMAPEQFEGKQASPATDMYALGLVLLEIVAGKCAFPSDNFLSGIAQRLVGDPPSPREFVPDLPDSWCSAINGCLRRNPSDRFQSVVEVIAALEDKRVVTQPVDNLHLIHSMAVGHWPIRRSLAVGAATLVAAVVFAVVVLREFEPVGHRHVVPGALIYLPPLRNQTDEKSLNNLTELLQAGLAQSTQVNLLDPPHVADTLQKMAKSPEQLIDPPIAREIAMRTGAVRIIFVTVSGSSGTYSLDIDIQQPDYTPLRFRDHWTNSFSWRDSGSNKSVGVIPPGLLNAVRGASGWIRNEAGESANDIARLDAPPGDVTTSNWDALSAYVQADKFLGRGLKAEAIQGYQSAIRSDPGFSLAYARLGDVLVSSRRTVEGYQAYVKALNSDSGQRLSRKERDYIQGSYASDTRDFATALAAFRDYSAFYPNDYTGWFYQSFPLDMLDRPIDAIQALKRAAALMPETQGGAEAGLAYNYMLLADYASARDWIEKLRAAGRHDHALYLQGLDQFLEQKYSQSADSFAELRQSTTTHYRSDGVAGLARVQAERGDYADSLDTLSTGIHAPSDTENPIDKGDRWLDRAYILCKLDDFKPCLDAISFGLSLDDSPDSVITASAIIGSSYKRMPGSFARQALDGLVSMERLIPDGNLGIVYAIARERVRGEILLAHGDASGAVLSFRKADALDFPLGVREYLARGLLAQADRQSNPAKARVLTNEAFALFEKAALRPAIVWRRVMDYPPGFAADQMASYIALARSLHYDNDDVHQVEKLLSGVRHARPAQSESESRITQVH